MNYLAHLLLAENTPGSIVGSLAPDFLRGGGYRAPNSAVLAGMDRHYLVDRFTDSHPVVSRSKRRISHVHGRYSGVIMDVLYDHFLSVNWSLFCREPLPEFVSRVYSILDAHSEWCPPRLQEALPYMQRQNWLLTYSSHEGIALTLERMSSRVGRGVRLETAVEQLVLHSAALDDDFRAFFPEVIAAVRGAPSGAHSP
jgi:acyl carrier protein phosphodiesterase